ncbi:anion transporter [Aureimonas sp. AU12]|uniref:anion transporter n=1 Tax=Aureimonas sp. AU12 TaxID=1638161 RepID=UPI0009E93ECB|nr:anion transporter [Aureimonas sp. AU12]
MTEPSTPASALPRRGPSLGAILAVAVPLVLLAALGLVFREPITSVLAVTPWSTDAAVVIFIATYAVIAIGKLPGTRLDRAGAALLGAGLMVGVGAMTMEEAFAAIDLDTIALLLGMMIVVANLRISGVFRLVNAYAVSKAHSPAVVLVAVVLATGVLSAFLVNDAICLVMTPLVIELTKALDRNPVPYLLGVALAANVGSTATITGNPQNMIIGTVSGIPYGSFAASLTPVAIVGLAIIVVIVGIAYRSEFLTKTTLPDVRLKAHVNKPLAIKATLLTLGMIVLFFLGQPVAKVAIICGGLLMLTRRVKPSRVYAEIDGALLIMFAGLFVVVAAIEHTVLTPDIIRRVSSFSLDDVWVLTGVTAVLSNIVSNVPAVLILRPFVEVLADPTKAWITVAMASTLAGNFTLLGSVANLIVAERAAASNIQIGFWTYFAVGAPVTLLTLAFGAWFLS